MTRIVLYVSFFAFMAGCTENHGSAAIADEAAYLKKGDSLVKITFDTLRNSLLRAIGEKGPAGALRFCNAEASSISSAYAAAGVAIGRVSDRNRNPRNALSPGDALQWKQYLQLLAKHDSLRSVVVYHDSAVHYYKPIFIQPMCLSCHGTAGEALSNDLIPVIDSLYPGDKAKGYRAGDLRGMWHIVFSETGK
jgi:hypothetical protein